MLLTFDTSLLEIMRQILLHHSAHTVLYYLAELEKFENPEEYASWASKLLNKNEE